MKAFWSKILLWFFLTFLGISLCFFGAAYFIESTAKNSERSQNVDDATGHRRIAAAVPKVELSASFLLIYGVTVATAFAITGWLVARKAFNPIISLNDQLDAIDPNNLQVQIRIETAESELRELQDHINGLISRISLTFHQLQSYSAQVAHELRAPFGHSR